MECQTAQREEESIAFIKGCHLLYADAEELNTEVNFKLNLKYTHGPLWRPDCRNTNGNKNMPAISLYITLFATGSTEWCFAMCFNSSMCFFCIPMPFILDTNKWKKEEKTPLLMLAMHRTEKMARTFHEMLSQQGQSVCSRQMQLLPPIFSLLLLVTCSYSFQLA